MRIIKREFQEHEGIPMFVVYFTNTKGIERVITCLVDDKHIVYSEQFMADYLMAMRIHGDGWK